MTKDIDDCVNYTSYLRKPLMDVGIAYTFYRDRTNGDVQLKVWLADCDVLEYVNIFYDCYIESPNTAASFLNGVLQGMLASKKKPKVNGHGLYNKYWQNQNKSPVWDFEPQFVIDYYNDLAKKQNKENGYAVL
jgi:hypothetical protein